MTRSSFKLRNEGTYLGILWYLLNPILLLIVTYIVFNPFFGPKIPYYPLYVFLGIIQFNFFTNATITSMKIIVSNEYIIKSINFKREFLVVSAVSMILLAHCIEMILFLVILLFMGVVPNFLVFIPIFLLFFIFTLGISFALASLFIYFRDLDYIWAFFNRILWLMTPVIFVITNNNLLNIINKYNPMYYVVSMSRDVLIYGNSPSFSSWIILVLLSVISLIIGMFIFAKLKKNFPELI